MQVILDAPYKQRYQNAIATTLFRSSRHAVALFRLLGVWFHPRLRGLFRAPHAVCIVYLVACSIINWRLRAVAPYVDVVMMGSGRISFGPSASVQLLTMALLARGPCSCSRLQSVALISLKAKGHAKKKESAADTSSTIISCTGNEATHDTASSSYGINPVPNSAATGAFRARQGNPGRAHRSYRLVLGGTTRGHTKAKSLPPGH
ncbi:hypothetical protein GGI35DRAFT_103822 [Trichoderma velutinum]